MLDSVLLGRTGILLTRSVAPFTLSDIIETYQRIADGTLPGATMSSPTIHDGRAAILEKPAPGEFGLFVMRRKLLQRGHKAGPLAILAPGLANFGRSRLYGILSHVGKIRDEDMTYVTEELGEALDWMEKQLAPDGPSASQIAEAIATVPLVEDRVESLPIRRAGRDSAQ